MSGYLVVILAILQVFNTQAKTTESPLDLNRGPIFLTEPPSTLSFANTKGSSVPCTAYGRPAPALDWVKDDNNPVEDVPGILQILSNNTLYFHPFQRKDFRTDVHAASYRCIASNTGGRISSRTLHVKAVLVEDYVTYNLQLIDYWSVLGGTAVFKCHINPYFVKDYIHVVGWTKGTKAIYPGERVSILSDGDLHIRDIRDTDKYTAYRCKARNILTGAEKYSKTAYLHIPDPPGLRWTEPKMDDFMPKVTVNEGDDVELPCVSSSNPLPQYRWSTKGRPLVIDSIHLKQKGGNLEIINAKVSDSGTYLCNSSNGYGSVTSTTELIVRLPLSATIDPPTQMIDSNQSAVFNCTALGHPIKSVTWLKDGYPIVASEKMSIKDESVLTINNVNRKDQGMYQCLVKNEETSTQGTAQLILGDAHPTFVETFEDQYVQTGQKLAIRCIAAGNPPPVINWTLDGTQLPQEIKSGSFIDSFGDVISYANISSMQIRYGGEYACISSNEVGKIRHVARVFVYGVPIVRPMNNITATASKRLSIRCYVAGYPVKSITWSKGGNVLPQNHRQKVVRETLYIEKVQKTHDIGEYVCTAKNSNGQGMSQSVFINVLEPPMIDPFRFPQKKQGDRIVVSCVVSSGDQPLQIEWTKDGEVIPPDMGIQIQKLNSFMTMLSIGDANPKHSGNYTCQASNAAATTKFTATLHVDVPPRWLIEPSDSFVILHKSVSLDCLTTGTPYPTISWKKAVGSMPGQYEQIDYITDDNATSEPKQLLSNGTLIMRNAKEADHGIYLCHSYNNVGPGLSKVIFLTVHIPARFDEGEKNYTVIKGQNKTMDCQAIGDKPLSVVWSFNTQALSTSGMTRRLITTTPTSRGKLSTLTLRPAERNDTGFYVCAAKNKFGDAVIAMRLVVLEIPEAPVNLTFVEKSSRSIKVRWMAPYNGNSPILYYIVQYKEESAVWQGILPNVTVSSSTLSTTIINLHPAYTYNVRVLANNSIGYGTPSESLTVELDEEKPSGPPTNVKVKAIGSETLKISWMPPKTEDQNGVIMGYIIGYKERDSQSRYIYITKAIDEDFEPVLDIHNLEKFTEYSVHILAYNNKGRGPISTDIEVFTLEDVPSQPPQGVQAFTINSRSIKVVWSPPPLFTLHGILQGYKIMYKPVRIDEDESDANTIVSPELEATISGLSKYTNYSIQVLAFTRKGEGVRCDPLYVRTQQDVPERPANIKALPVNNSTVLVAWKPPLHSNGILTKYNIYIYYDKNSNKAEDVLEVSPVKTSFYKTNLSLHEEVTFEVSASTIIGEGEKTHAGNAAPQEKVAARIASFSAVMLIPWQHTLTLQCLAVGDPIPAYQWKIRGHTLVENERIQILKNGSLHINGVLGTDAANYSCRAENKYGSDEVNYAISVQAPPKPPTLYVVATTTSTIQVNWRSGSNGGSPIQGFTIHHKKDHEVWQTINTGSSNRTNIITGLLCGTMYKFYINAFNRLGKSPNSDIISIKTNGSTPIMPPQSELLKVINVTSVDLDLSTWRIDKCPVRFYSVKYQVWGDKSWTEVSNNIQRNKTVHTIDDLHPATWYVMKVTAHSDAGSTESQLKFSTLTYHGNTITPLYISHKQEVRFYERTQIMIPLCFGIVSFLVLMVAILLYLKRRRELVRLKESSSNLRRDITAETSLMNDLDKRLNFDFDISGNTEPYGKRNVNLLISFNSDENLHSNSPAWLNNGSSKTNSDNGSITRSEDDGNINPYATFNQMKQVIAETIEQPERENSPDFDDISLQKLEAQKAMTSPSEPYVPFFHTKGDNAEVTKDPHPPLIPLKTTEGYDNQGLILSPRKYASADQIHALFTQGPARPHSSYSKSQKSHSHASSDEKGSQRQSIISSVTTVSSSRDELLEALENAKRNPPPPVLYESQPESSSQPTDSSVGTEPGIVMFTQSPPKPNEQREASCEVHYAANSESKPSTKRSRKEAESDTTECETNEKPAHHPRRIRGRHRNKQRGTLAKRQIIPAFVPRAHSRTSTTSSEEVTYTFEGRDSPNSPSEGYLSYLPDSQGYPESDLSSHRRGGRRTPHCRVRYDTSLQTPGTDESRPLVTAVAQPSMSSPAEEEEDATVSLLDRHYRPVENQEIDSGIKQCPRDKGYRDDFTLV